MILSNAVLEPLQ